MLTLKELFSFYDISVTQLYLYTHVYIYYYKHFFTDAFTEVFTKATLGLMKSTFENYIRKVTLNVKVSTVPGQTIAPFFRLPFHNYNILFYDLERQEDEICIH